VIHSPGASDEDVARERTALAWTRSGLAFVVCIAVLVRHLWPTEGTGRNVLVGLIAAAAIAWSIALLAFTRIDADRDGPRLLRPRLFVLMTAGTLLLAMGGLLLAFFAEP
jgi:hypothetical protein